MQKRRIIATSRPELAPFAAKATVFMRGKFVLKAEDHVILSTLAPAMVW